MATEQRILALTMDQISRLTGVSSRQLRYWDDTSLFSPQCATANRRRPYSRTYSFRDVVGLRVLAILRNDYGIPLQGLRKANDWLKARYDAPWSSLVFYVVGKDVAFEIPDSNALVSPRRADQIYVPTPIDVGQIERNMDKTINDLWERKPFQIGKIERHRNIQHNAWVIAGTRIPTWSVMEYHEAGYDTNAILDRFPSLQAADVEAAIHHEEKLNSRKRVG